jgi:L-aspartate oxidase
VTGAAALDVGTASWEREADVVVVGSGAAGLAAALGLLRAGVRVTLVTKGRLGDGATVLAQGGLAAALDPGDRVDAHAQDTVIAGAGVSEPLAAAALAASAPQAIRMLDALGARFDRAPDGTLELGLEGGHSARRIVHAGGDASGAEVIRALAAATLGALESERGELLEGALAVDALPGGDGSVRGLRVIDAHGAVGELTASAVVLASGGIGQAWTVTTNPEGATGDGLALALRAGAVIRDPEFVQFHPTALSPAGQARGARACTQLVSEAVRGEGGRLLDIHGIPILDGIHPLGDLAPRDVVAAAIHRRMLDTHADHVLLDATGLSADTWRHRFPTILASCAAHGLDPTARPIPVAPAQHYHCGGVQATLDGATSVPGLYAVGEVAATGLHGANRLASNSLTEALIAGQRASAVLRRPPTRRAPDGAPPAGRLLTPGIRALLRGATSRGSGVMRDAGGLQAQLHALRELQALTARPDQLAPGALREAVEATNLHLLSRAVATGALRRTESRGCHRRRDFPGSHHDWRRAQLLALVDGELAPAGTEPAIAA